jgi:dipeptidyl aminopeptidase/acylaminoacyl peptidase
MKTRVVAVILLVVAAVAYAGNEAAIIPRRALFGPADRGSIKLSTDGTRIAFLAGGSLWVAPVKNPGKRDKTIDGPISSYEWAYTGKHVLYRANGHVYAFDLEQKSARDLGDGQIAKQTPPIPDEVLIATNAEHPDLVRVSITTGESRSVLRNPGYDQFYADFDFQPRIAIREASDGGYELSTPKADGRWRVLYTIPLAATTVSRPIGVNGDGTLLYVVDNKDGDKAALRGVELRTGKVTTLLAHPLIDLTPAVLFDPRTGNAESITGSWARTTRLYLNEKLRNEVNYLKKIESGDVGIAGRSADDTMWLIAILNGGPALYYAHDRRAHRATFLLTEYDTLMSYQLARREAVEYRTRDGIKLPGDLYWPPWVARTKDAHLPMVIVVHGGPSVAYPWNSWTTNRMLQLLANRGYLAFRVEFRGAGGFGKKILHAGDHEWGAKMNDDLIDAANWAAAQGFADRDRVGVMGWSYGGYATVAALTFTPDAFACGVAMYPVTDLMQLVSSRDPFVRSLWREQLGDETTEKGRALVEARSPVRFAERVKKPLLITHGTKDVVVAPSHSEDEVKALEAAGRDVVFLRFTDEGHDYEQPKNLAAFFAAAEGFLATHLGGRAEPPGEDMKVASLEVLR